MKWKEIGVDAGHDVNKFIILISFRLDWTIRSVENRRDWQTFIDETRYTRKTYNIYERTHKLEMSNLSEEEMNAEQSIHNINMDM